MIVLLACMNYGCCGPLMRVLLACTNWRCCDALKPDQDVTVNNKITLNAKHNASSPEYINKQNPFIILSAADRANFQAWQQLGVQAAQQAVQVTEMNISLHQPPV